MEGGAGRRNRRGGYNRPSKQRFRAGKYGIQIAKGALKQSQENAMKAKAKAKAPGPGPGPQQISSNQLVCQAPGSPF